jgi:hypothetical protein
LLPSLSQIKEKAISELEGESNSDMEGIL